MDLSSLDIFNAVCEHSSVTGAAKALGRVPSNVTTRIRQLEQDLGATLFSRDGKKMTLTEEGRIFQLYSGRMLQLAEEAREAVRPSGISGILRVGSMESTAASRLPDVLAQFHARWPSVSLQLTMGASRGLAEAVLRNELDCALIALPPVRNPHQATGSSIDVARFDLERIFVEELVIVLPKAHPPVRSAVDLRVQTLAALEPGCTYRGIAEDWVEPARSVATLQVGSYHAILANVAAGGAIGVMPKSVLDLMSGPAAMVRTHSLGPIDTVLVHRRGEASGSIRAFRNALVATQPRRAT